MSDLRHRLIVALERRNYSQATMRSYVSHLKLLALYYNSCPSKLSAEQLQAYLDYLRQDKGLASSSINGAHYAIKFLWEHVLDRVWPIKSIIRLKTGKKLPEILSRQEVQQLISGTLNQKHRCLLQTIYSTGLRLGEVVDLEPFDIDSKRMVVRVRQGKGKKDRYTLLSPILLRELRLYFRRWRHRCRHSRTSAEYRPKRYLFEGRTPGQAISRRTVQAVFQQARQRAAIRRKVGVHVLRHCFATHLLESGVELMYLKALMGHSCIKTTTRYLHIAQQPSGPIDDLLED